MGQESDRLLRELVEKEAIRDMVHRYCWSVDRGELQDVMALFHDSCDLIVSPPGRRREGRAAVERWYGRYMRHRLGVLRHLIHNQVITLDGDRAFSKSYFDAVGDLKGESVVVAGFYEDKLLRVEGEWKFTEKVIGTDFMVPLHEGWGGEKFKVRPWWYEGEKTSKE